MELTEKQKTLLVRNFKMMFNDFTESIYWGDTEQVCPIEDFYKDFYNKEKDIFYFCMDWDTYDDEESVEKYVVGTKEELSPCWDMAATLALRICNVIKKLRESGFKELEVVRLTNPFRVNDNTIVAVRIGNEGELEYIGKSSLNNQEWFIKFDMYEEYARIADGLENTGFKKLGS